MKFRRRNTQPKEYQMISNNCLRKGQARVYKSPSLSNISLYLFLSFQLLELLHIFLVPSIYSSSDIMSADSRAEMKSQQGPDAGETQAQTPDAHVHAQEANHALPSHSLLVHHGVTGALATPRPTLLQAPHPLNSSHPHQQ